MMRPMTGTQTTTMASPGRATGLPDGDEGVPVLREVVSFMNRLSKIVVGLILLVMIMFIGWMDRVVGDEVSLFVLYAVPIALSVSVLSLRAGVASAMLCALTWWIANRPSGLYATEAGYFLAMVSRLFYFGMVVVAVSSVRNKHQADAARIAALEERRHLERELVRVSEREQQRIGRDLHDGLCQRLAAIGCAARMLSDDLQARDVTESQDAAMIESAIQEAVMEARSLARGIFPVQVDSASLPAALSDLAKTMSRLTGANIEVTPCEEEIAVNPTVAMHLYRIAQEAVANAVRHSDAVQIRVTLQILHDSMIELRIEDDGKGFQPQTERRLGMGLRTMRYRAEAVGGQIGIGPRPGGGTVVSCRVSLLDRRPFGESEDEGSE